MKPTVHQGKLVDWKDERGFGFIKPGSGGKDVFLHISAFKTSSRRPQVGDLISYQLTSDKNGRIRAYQAVIDNLKNNSTTTNNQNRSQFKPTKTNSKLGLEVLFLSVIPLWGAFDFALKMHNPIPLCLYPAMSYVTFLLYADDKSRAQCKQWRTPEKTLHFCELTGGWIGAFIAQRKLRHKNKKESYQIVFWLIVIIHLGFWVNWLFLGGNIWQSLFS